MKITTNLARVFFALTTLLISAVTLPALAMEGHFYSMQGMLVHVGGRMAHVNCIGSGTPTVILDSGLGGTSLDWALVQPEVAKTTRVCSYDRAGYGWSDASPQSRTSLDIVRELHALLQAAHIPAPYVLVGHSFGGLNMQLFASLYPQETESLVLVDSMNAKQIAAFESGAAHVITAPQGRNFVLFSGAPVPPQLPPSLQPVARQLASTQMARITVRRELADLRMSAREVTHAPPLPDVPLVVITRGKRVWPMTEQGNLMEKTWMELQDELAQRVPHAVHLIAESSGHYVQLEEPAVVINAIQVVVESARPSKNAPHLVQYTPSP